MAFASGGSNGYDHKAMGITAKGGLDIRSSATSLNGHRRPARSPCGRRLRRHVGRRFRQRHAASQNHSSSSRVRTTATSSSIPILTAKSWSERKRLFRAAALQLGGL
jgi:glutamate dehydrogenase